MDDLTYYNNFLDGNEEAFRYLLEKYANHLILFISTYVDNYHTAEDIMEDCFVELLMKKSIFRGESSFKTFLFQIAKFKAFDHLKKRNRIKWVREEDVASDLGEENRVLEELIDEEEKRKLHQAIKKLPDNYRQAIHLFYFEEMSYAGVAKVMNKTEKQIDNYLYRAKQYLKEILEKEEN